MRGDCHTTRECLGSCHRRRCWLYTTNSTLNINTIVSSTPLEHCNRMINCNERRDKINLNHIIKIVVTITGRYPGTLLLPSGDLGLGDTRPGERDGVRSDQTLETCISETNIRSILVMCILYQFKNYS